MKTTLHAYAFDVTKPQEAAAYEQLCSRMKRDGIRCFETWGGGGSHYMPSLDGKTVELETQHIFSDQWNTAPIDGDSAKTGRRVFDWAQDYPINFGKHIRRGHYLDITEEMRAIRRDTLQCGYCGAYAPVASGQRFCRECLGSEYLKSSDLLLLRMVPIERHGDERAPLTEEEQAELLPLYKSAQIHGNTERSKARIAKARADVIAKADKAGTTAVMERDGFLWFMDRGINTSNLIYYSHTGRFCFGWRQPVDAAIVSEILDVISEFPFPYDIKCADGRTLSGD